MSLKTFICLCLVVATGSFGALGEPKAMAQVGHGIGQATPLSEADMNEVKQLIKTSLLPALMSMQQGITVMIIDPDEACLVGKATDSKLMEFRRGLAGIRDRLSREGKDTSQLNDLIYKADVMLSDGKKPSDIFCKSGLKPEKLTPEDRAIFTKISGYISDYTRAMVGGLQAAMDNDAGTACVYFQQARAKLAELDVYLSALKSYKQAGNEDVSQYDRLLLVNAKNKQQIEQLIAKGCPAS